MSIRIMPHPVELFARTTAQGEFRIGWSGYGQGQSLVMFAGVPLVMGAIAVSLFLWGPQGRFQLSAMLVIVIVVSAVLLWFARAMRARRQNPVILSVDARSRRVVRAQVNSLKNRVVQRIAHELWRVNVERELGTVREVLGVVRVWTSDVEDGDGVVLLTHHGTGSTRFIRQLESACAVAGLSFDARDMKHESGEAPEDVRQYGVNQDHGDRP